MDIAISGIGPIDVSIVKVTHKEFAHIHTFCEIYQIADDYM